MRTAIHVLLLVLGACGRLHFDPGDIPERVVLRAPWNGAATGSVWATNAQLTTKPLRPRFRWEPAAGAARYELELTPDCPITGFATCAFARPDRFVTTETELEPPADLEVAHAPPVGTRYFWRVRACSDVLCAEWSEVRYLDVGRLGDDYDGDGYSDLLACAGSPALAYVFRGGATGIVLTPSLMLTDADPSFAELAASLGDIDADGFADAAIGGEGIAWIYRGSPAGLFPSATLRDSSSAFGAAIAAGDIDADGLGEVAMGDYLLGTVQLFEDDGTGLHNTVTLHGTDIDGAPASFGFQLALGRDLDGDGVADLAIGSLAGSVFVMLGPIEPNEAPVASIAPPPNSTNFGLTITVADVDGDGVAEVAIGDPYIDNPDTSEGRAYLVKISETGAGPLEVLYAPEGGQTTFVSVAIARGDVDGDGHEDIAVAALGEQPAATRTAEVFRGADTTAPPYRLSGPKPASNVFAGQGIASADFNGDGYADIAVGVASQDNPEALEGNVFVYAGSSSGPATSGVTIDSPSDAANGHFGFSLATAP